MKPLGGGVGTSASSLNVSHARRRRDALRFEIRCSRVFALVLEKLNEYFGQSPPSSLSLSSSSSSRWLACAVWSVFGSVAQPPSAAAPTSAPMSVEVLLLIIVVPRRLVGWPVPDEAS